MPHHVMAPLDNLMSRVQPWLSDALCTLATGGGFATRTLYENDEETILNAQRPVILTGIDELARRGDLLSRCIILRLPVIQDSDRRTEAELMMAFENTLPDVLGGLLDAAAQALAQHASLQLPFKPRMADFATWVEAGASALGLERGQFLDAYARNRVDANDIALDVSPLPGAIRALMSVQKDCAWVGTATELLVELKGHVSDDITQLRIWPKTVQSLGSQLRRLAPHLREAGIDVVFDREPGGTRRRVTRLRLQPDVPNVPERPFETPGRDDTPSVSSQKAGDRPRGG